MRQSVLSVLLLCSIGCATQETIPPPCHPVFSEESLKIKNGGNEIQFNFSLEGKGNRIIVITTRQSGHYLRQEQQINDRLVLIRGIKQSFECRYRSSDDYSLSHYPLTIIINHRDKWGRAITLFRLYSNGEQLIVNPNRHQIRRGYALQSAEAYLNHLSEQP